MSSATSHDASSLSGRFCPSRRDVEAIKGEHNCVCGSPMFPEGNSLATTIAAEHNVLCSGEVRISPATSHCRHAALYVVVRLS